MHVSRVALTLALVGLAGLAAGFLSYRVTQPRLALAPPGPATQPADDAPPAPRPVPTEVPEMTLPDPAGKRHSLRDYVGHPLIINFWATWCAPCRREMPLLGQLRGQYRRDGL